MRGLRGCDGHERCEGSERPEGWMAGGLWELRAAPRAGGVRQGTG